MSIRQCLFNYYHWQKGRQKFCAVGLKYTALKLYKYIFRTLFTLLFSCFDCMFSVELLGECFNANRTYTACDPLKAVEFQLQATLTNLVASS